MIYVGSPYSSPIVGLAETRYLQVCEFIDRMIAAGFIAFSPIVYLHPIAARLNLPGDARTWMRFNLSMLRRAEAMYLLELPGWDNSKGLKIEMNVCTMLDLPCIHYSADYRLVSKSWSGNVPEKF